MTVSDRPDDSSSGAPAPAIRRLVGVYDADGTLRGEVAYVVGKLLGRAHCALCDITHGAVRTRSEWKACRATLPVAFDTYHRDDQPAAARPLTDGRLPAVLAETAAGFVLLLGPDELEGCAKSPERLVASLADAVGGAGLAWGA